MQLTKLWDTICAGARQRRQFQEFITQQEKRNMAVSAEIAAVLEESRALSGAVGTVDAKLKAVIAQLAAQSHAPGLSDEDKAALATSSAFIQSAITTLNAAAAS